MRAGQSIAHFVVLGRRRLGLVRAGRVLSVMAPATLTLGFGIAIVAPSWVWPLAVAAGTALAVASLGAFVTRPTQEAVADLADERLQLRDRIGAAFRSRSRQDDIALAIVEDAARHLPPAAVGQAFPFTTHPHATGSTMVAVVSSCAWLVLAPSAPGTAGASGGGIRFASARSAGSAATDAESTTASRAPAARPEAARPDTETPTPASPTGTNAPPPAEFGELPERARDLRTSAARASVDEARASVPNVDDALPQASTARDVAAAGAGGAGSRGATDSRSTSTAAARGRSATGRPGASDGDAGASAVKTPGGVASGRLTGARAAERAGAPAAAGARGIGSASAIEAAIDHQDVAPRQRLFLREYQRLVEAISQP